MAITQNFSITRNEVVAATNAAGRGLVLNGQQAELVRITKLTADVAGPIIPEAVLRPNKVYALALTDNLGAILATESPLAPVAFTQGTGNTINVSGLGTYTAAYLLVTGRSNK